MTIREENIQRHIQQWTHNRSLIGRIPPEYPDWIVTVSFYAAIHAIDALLVSDETQGIVSHSTRNGVLAKTNRYKAIYRSYHTLYDLSRTVRYLAEPNMWIPLDQIEVNVLERCFYKIEKSVKKLLKIDLELGKIIIPKAA